MKDERVTPRVLERLKQFTRSRQNETSMDRCDLCGTAIAPEHEHLVERATRKLRCSCYGCSLLFPTRGGPQRAAARFARVPREVKRLPGLSLTDSQWTSFLIPIGLAFFFHSSEDNRYLAIYPSPAGPTEADLPHDAWETVARANPALRLMESDVEALLINRTGNHRDYFLSPIDQCYRLVGLLRAKWKGFSGGVEVWDEISQFFAQLRLHSRPLAEAPHV